jgi:spore maturation protein CgeB
VMLGLSATSSWGNGHATNYRGLAEALLARGHEVLFLERDKPWYASTRDYDASWIRLYDSPEDLERFAEEIRDASLAIVGSYVPDGVAVCRFVLDRAEGVTAFWDIDTPVTAAKMAAGDHEYLEPSLVPAFDLYLSFTGGPFLDALDARRPRAFHCLVDPAVHLPVETPQRWTLGYLGTWSADRQPKVDGLILEPARRSPAAAFVVAGPLYPPDVDWPGNVLRIENLPPAQHAAFYCSQRFTLNVTRADMVAAGWSPSVRLFEAAACGTPVISDWWDGLDAFFEPGEEILVAGDAEDVLRHLRDVSGARRAAMATRARARVLREHTASQRVAQLERFVREITGGDG